MTAPQDLSTATPVSLALVVNGEPTEAAVRTLADLIAALGYGDARLATARNGEFVAQKARASTMLESGDHIEIVAPRQGG